MKLKPMKRSLVTHQRVDHLRQLEAFVEGLVNGQLDDMVQEMADNVDPKKLENVTPINDLIEEMKALKTGDIDKDAASMNAFIDEHQNHPQSILLMRALAHEIGDNLDEAGKESLKKALMNELM